MSRRSPCDHLRCEHYLTYDQVEAELWSDRMSRDAVRTNLVAELTAHCDRCQGSFFFEITGDRDRWFIQDRRVDRDQAGRWTHGAPDGRPACRGELRLAGVLPTRRPKRILLERGWR